LLGDNKTKWVLQKLKNVTKMSHSFVHLPNQRKQKSVVKWHKEEWLKKSMVETIQQIQKTHT
jgi:hypothetical protein